MPTTPPKKKKAKKTAKRNTSKSKALTKATPKKMGRPTKYKPEYCQMLIEHMAEGYPFETFAALIGTHRATLYNWVDSNVDFFDARKKGQEMLYLHLVKVGKRIAMGGGGNPTAWIFMMKNICGWRNELQVKADVTVTPHDLLIQMAEEAESGEVLEAEEAD